MAVRVDIAGHQDPAVQGADPRLRSHHAAPRPDVRHPAAGDGDVRLQHLARVNVQHPPALQVEIGGGGAPGPRRPGAAGPRGPRGAGRVVRRIPEDEGAEPAAGSLRGTAYMRRWNHQGRHAYIFVGDDGDSAIPFAVQRSGGARMELTYFGHARFLLRAADATTSPLDPYDTSVGYPLPDVAPTALTVSHEHFDHNHVQAVKGNPKVI